MFYTEPKQLIFTNLALAGSYPRFTNLALAGSYPRFKSLSVSVIPKKEAFNLKSFYFKHFSIYFPLVIVTLKKLSSRLSLS